MYVYSCYRSITATAGSICNIRSAWLVYMYNHTTGRLNTSGTIISFAFSHFSMCLLSLAMLCFFVFFLLVLLHVTGAPTCRTCPLGTVMNNNNECVTCPAGTTYGRALDGYTGVCTSPPTCVAGAYYNAATGNCTLCPIGTYSSAAGATMCTSCPAGTSGNVTGATSAGVACTINTNQCPTGMQMTALPTSMGAYYHLPSADYARCAAAGMIFL